MSPEAIVALLVALEPAAKDAITALIAAFHAKQDPAAARAALESLQRLEFVAANERKLDG